MKGKLFILTGIIVFSGFGFSTSCNFYLYEQKDNKIIYSEGITPGMHSKKTNEVRKADVKTFAMLDRSGLAKDKNNLYYMGKIVRGIDGSTLEVVSKHNENYLAETTAAHCFSPYVKEVKDKNGNYLIEDIRAGMYELAE